MAEPTAKSVEERLKKYSWVKLPNGKFAILHVPIFQLFHDQERGEVGLNKARQILQVFQQDAKNGYFPRVFLGHHSDGGVENRPGVGFADNLKLESDGVFYADLVDIVPECFEEMKGRNKYPNRSVEYNDEKRRITGVALLESQPSFFQFPMLALEDKEFEGSSAMFQDVSRKSFCDGNCDCEKKGGNNMPDEIEKISPETGGDKTEETKPETPEKFCKYQDGGGLDKKMDMILESVQKLVEILGEHTEKEEEREGYQENEEGPGSESDIETVPEDISDEEKNIGKKPGSVAMQLNAMKKEIAALKSEKQYGERLQRVCEEKSLNFQQHNKFVSKFQDAKDKQSYIEMLENTDMPGHRMSQFSATPIPQQGDVLQKFQAEVPAMQKVAREAFVVWRHTFQAVPQFRKEWPDANKFVAHVVENEKIGVETGRSPGEYLASLGVKE